jgi:hypothetical protein
MEPDEINGKFDAEGHRYRRRMSDQKIKEIADSALLKLMHYAVTLVVIPLVAWAMATLLERLGKIEESLNRATTQSATFELRVQALERSGIERDAAIKLLLEQGIRHDYDIRSLKERFPPR